MITMKDIRRHCSEKKGVIEDFPFDTSTLVFRVGPRIFLLTDIDAETLRINLKCDPFLSLELRGRYPQITPGYHMNKKHWNTVLLDGAIPDNEVYRLIDHSYELVLGGLKRRDRERVEAM
ncbi:MAG: MmcQ/YjbR family DNA-binding protein [Spirochaetes bacterium]|nr:MmcQ/YjbR family DNA-binding protein [Spirochaetota bacterium]